LTRAQRENFLKIKSGNPSNLFGARVASLRDAENCWRAIRAELSRMGLRELLLGKPLRTEEEQSEQIGVAAGIPVLGLDALGSAAYGPEAALTVLFADFPRVCRALALDEYLPAEFAHRGSRLVYTSGIIVLAALSAVLLVAFRGVTDRLIPLFAVGAFSAFTLSQIGMVMHWHRARDAKGRRRSLFFNGLGACATFATLVIITISKFKQGAWLTVLVIPPMVLLFLRVRKYHSEVSENIKEEAGLDLSVLPEPIVAIPVKRLDGVSRKAIRLAMRLASDVHVVQVLSEAMKTEDLTAHW
jgi:hypothetical protein